MTSFKFLCIDANLKHFYNSRAIFGPSTGILAQTASATASLSKWSGLYRGLRGWKGKMNKKINNEKKKSDLNHGACKNETNE